MARQRVPRATLTRASVLRAAIALADDVGVESLTMRRLGRELGVEAMSLYNHVANKQDLLAGMVDAVVAEFDVPAPASGWRSELRRAAISSHDVLRRHPWACRLLVSSPPMTGPARHRHMDAMLHALRGAGLSVSLTDHAFHVLDGYILGFTVQQVSFPAPTEDLAARATEFVAQLPADQFPWLVEHIRHHIDSGHYDEGDFEFGLDLILDSLERLLRDAASGMNAPGRSATSTRRERARRRQGGGC
jgi:AcrR family transcriptional regulator